MENLAWLEITARILTQLIPVWIALVVTFIVSIKYKRSLGLYGKLFDSNVGMIGFCHRDVLGLYGCFCGCL